MSRWPRVHRFGVVTPDNTLIRDTIVAGKTQAINNFLKMTGHSSTAIGTPKYRTSSWQRFSHAGFRCVDVDEFEKTAKNYRCQQEMNADEIKQYLTHAEKKPDAAQRSDAATTEET